MVITPNKWWYLCIVSRASLSFCSLLRVGKCGRPQSLLFSSITLEHRGTLAGLWEGTVTYKPSITTASIILQSYSDCFLRPYSHVHENTGLALFAYGLCGVKSLYAGFCAIACCSSSWHAGPRTPVHRLGSRCAPRSGFLLQWMWQSPQEA